MLSNYENKGSKRKNLKSIKLHESRRVLKIGELIVLSWYEAVLRTNLCLTIL